MDRRSRIIALIKHRRAMGPVARPRRVLPRQAHPEGIQVDFWKAIQPIVDRTRDLINREIVPYLPHVLAEHERSRMRADATTPADLSARFAKLSREVVDMLHPAQLDTLARQFGQQTSAFQKAQLNAQVRAALGVDLSAMEPELAGGLNAFVADSVRLIRSIPMKYLSDVEEDVVGALRSGSRWETLATDIEERYGITTRRAQLIARDQVGKFFGELNSARQQSLGVTGYIWRTSRDARVRDEHAEREGESFDWNSPPEDGPPGEPINCRCYAEPDFSTLGLDD